MKASQILERTAEKYANCLNYCDSGLVEFDTPDDLHETICFRTRFERPSLFTFEWQDYGPNRGKTEEYSLLWSVNGEAETVAGDIKAQDFGRFQWELARKMKLMEVMLRIWG